MNTRRNDLKRGAHNERSHFYCISVLRRRHFGGVNIIMMKRKDWEKEDKKKYKYYYDLLDLYTIRKPEPYGKLSRSKKAIIKEDVIEMGIDQKHRPGIPSKILQDWYVIISRNDVKSIIQKELANRNKGKLSSKID
jgi:hypothetical protein